ELHSPNMGYRQRLHAVGGRSRKPEEELAASMLAANALEVGRKAPFGPKLEDGRQIALHRPGGDGSEDDSQDALALELSRLTFVLHRQVLLVDRLEEPFHREEIPLAPRIDAVFLRGRSLQVRLEEIIRDGNLPQAEALQVLEGNLQEGKGTDRI